jgi:RNA polymerase sigma factor (TIGR02999 family)
VKTELRRLARRYMANERAGHLLQTTALVNEAYLRLIDWNQVDWQSRAHFFGVSARLMRNILVDYARQRPRVEGGRDAHPVSFDEALVVTRGRSGELVAIDDVLKALEKLDPRKGRIVELRFFGGLGVEETAAVLKISRITVIREWKRAKAWLHRELTQEESHGA